MYLISPSISAEQLHCKSGRGNFTKKETIYVCQLNAYCCPNYSGVKGGGGRRLHFSFLPHFLQDFLTKYVLVDICLCVTKQIFFVRSLNWSCALLLVNRVLVRTNSDKIFALEKRKSGELMIVTTVYCSTGNIPRIRVIELFLTARDPLK